MKHLEQLSHAVTFRPRIIVFAALVVLVLSSTSARRVGLAVMAASIVGVPSATVAPAAEDKGTAIRPFRVDVPDKALADLRRRFAATQWPDGVYANLGNMITGAGWISGGPGFPTTRRFSIRHDVHVDGDRRIRHVRRREVVEISRLDLSILQRDRAFCHQLNEPEHEALGLGFDDERIDSEPHIDRRGRAMDARSPVFHRHIAR